jgi:hypothetical protein
VSAADAAVPAPDAVVLAAAPASAAAVDLAAAVSAAAVVSAANSAFERRIIHSAGSLRQRPALWHFWNPRYRRTFAAILG